MSKFKVGDKVVVAAEDVCNRKYCWNDGMAKWCGKTVTIDGIRADMYAPYLIKEDHGEFIGQEHDGWRWGEDMFAGLATHPKILITTDGTTTLARLYEGKKVVRTAQAKCAPGDTFDFTTGANLAYDRLMDRLPATPPKAEKPAQEPIKLYCVRDDRGYLTKGKVYEFDGHQVNYDNGHECFFFSSFEAWKNGDRNLSASLVPLVKRPAKVGEYILPEDEDKPVKVVRMCNLACVVLDDGRHTGSRPYRVLDGYKG